MKITAKQLVPAHYNIETIGITCDSCKKEYNACWNRRSSFEVLEVDIHMRIGDSYPEGGSGTELRPDICPDCFKNKVIPFLISIGVPIIWNEWDW